MKLLVFGAAGLTGRHVVSMALAQGHDVTAFVRESAKIAIANNRLRVAVGSADDSQAIGQAVKGQDVAISTLGAGQSLNPRGLIERCARVIVPALESAGVRRLIWTSGFGAGGTIADTPFLPRIFLATLLRSIYADKRKGEALIRRSSLEWTLVCPTSLTNGEPTGSYRAGERLELRGMPSVARADVAQFILTQVDDRTYIRKEVLVTSAGSVA
jgi:putative NADH-flavin reductase